MMLQSKMQYTLTLNGDELGIICRALRGETKEGDGAKGIALEEEIVAARLGQQNSIADSFAKFEKNVSGTDDVR